MQYTTKPSPTSSAGFSQITDAMRSYIDQNKIPGIVAAVQRHGHIEYFECFGMMDIQAKKPMQPDTIFEILSMTKPITCVAALTLIERGQLQLDDPVSRFIPEFGSVKVFDGVTDGTIQLADLKRPMTIYDLLTHTSGLAYGHSDPLLRQLYEHTDLYDPSYTLDEMMSRMVQLPLAHQPGCGWTYGTSHDALARIIEIVTGLHFDQALKQLVLEPLGMVDSDASVPDDKLHRLATVYAVEADGTFSIIHEPNSNPFAHPHNLFLGGGCLFSTTHDYLRFAQMLLNSGSLDGVRILSPDTIKFMTINHLKGDLYPMRFGDFIAKGEGYGMGVGILVEPSQAEFPGSAGSYTWSGGFSTHFWIDPKEELIGVLMAQFGPMFHYPIHLSYRNLVYQSISPQPR